MSFFTNFTSLFSSNSNQGSSSLTHARQKSRAMRTTDDAFSRTCTHSLQHVHDLA